MLFQTTTEHEQFRAKIRSFAEEEIKPIAFSLDQENRFPEEAVKKLGEMGLMGIPYPAEYGGAGLDVVSYAIAVEELSRVDGGSGVILSAHVSLGSYPIFAFGKLRLFLLRVFFFGALQNYFETFHSAHSAKPLVDFSVKENTLAVRRLLPCLVVQFVGAHNNAV